MIKFTNTKKEQPYRQFIKYYKKAELANQRNIEAILISSFSRINNEVDARYVNLKYIQGDEFTFFSNYNSEKSNQFDSHNQISAVIFWNNINVQIRIKGKIKKLKRKNSIEYFKKREPHKNALAISSYQSMKISSYADIEKSYEHALKNDDLKKCPEYWGGYSFTPYYFEFWEGHESRINKREVFNKIDGVWKQSFLQP